MSELPSASASVSASFDPVATQLWTQRFARFATANLSVAAFCNVEGVAKSGFFRWRRRLALTPTKPNHDKTRAPKLTKTTVAPLRVTDVSHSTASIELILHAGRLIRFPLDTKPELILAIIRGLETISC